MAIFDEVEEEETTEEEVEWLNVSKRKSQIDREL
jgi:hypothetical protein